MMGFFDGYFLYYMLYNINLFLCTFGISMCSMATEEVENTAALYPSLPNFFTKWKRAKHEK